jgi:DNA-binding Lrp family transcriptional regulator
MDKLQRHFINQFQGGFPLVENPYSSVAAELDTDEVTLISLIGQLLDDGILSRFGPMYDAVNMGGSITLAALCVADDVFDEIAGKVNRHAEIAHNYRRDHELNMWFVIATESAQGILNTIKMIEAETGLKVFNFPKLREFYLGLWLMIDDQGQVATCSVDVPSRTSIHHLDALDRRIIAETQGGLPLLAAPYTWIAEQTGSETSTVIERMKRMLHHGVIRRIGAVPNHYRLGLKANGMSVWDVPDEQLSVLGDRVGQLDFVSHCYERPRHLPQWPYNLFAMVHGHDHDEVNRKVRLIAELLGHDCRQYHVLFSSAILKKTGMRLAA